MPTLAKRTKRALLKLWHKVNEPRATTMLAALGYAVLTFGGISALVNPPRSIEGTVGDASMLLLAAMLTGGGLLGVVTSITGFNWLERGAVQLCGAALSIYAAIVITMGILAESGNRDLQAAVVIFAALMVAARGVYIWHRPYAQRVGGRYAADA